MTGLDRSDPSERRPISYTRRLMFRVAGALGFAGTGAVLSAAAAAKAGDAAPADVPDPVGDLGHPPAAGPGPGHG